MQHYPLTIFLWGAAILITIHVRVKIWQNLWQNSDSDILAADLWHTFNHEYSWPVAECGILPAYLWHTCGRPVAYLRPTCGMIGADLRQTCGRPPAYMYLRQTCGIFAAYLQQKSVFFLAHMRILFDFNKISIPYRNILMVGHTMSPINVYVY